MDSEELLAVVSKLTAGRKLPVLIRGENVVTEISSVYIDTDHTDDSPFLSIDLEPEESLEA